MTTSEFSIIKATRGAYIFLAQEWKYLLRLSLLPLGVNALTQLLLLAQGPGTPVDDMSSFELFLWNLPANILIGWFLFQESRLLLLGERAETLPANAEYLSARRDSLKASVIIWLLFNMGCSTLIGYHEWALSLPKEQQEFWPVGIGAVLFGLFFWNLRFGVAHILAAVDYPLRSYVRLVSGLGISLRLAALSLLTCLPLIVLFYIVVAIIVPETGQAGGPGDIALVALLSALLSVASSALMNAAGAYALQEMLNGGRDAS